MTQSLSRLARREEIGGEPFPAVFSSFEQNKILFRKASLHMICGIPGCGKSAFTLSVMAKLNVPTLYFSSDSDFFTMASRLLAIKTGKTTDETERILVSKKDYASSILRQYDHTRWNFLPSPTLDDIWLEAEAYLELYGFYPQLVVVDIAMDVDHQDGDEFATLRSLAREMKRFARDTGACVVLVHHTTEAVPGYPVQPRSAIMGKIAQLPVLILNLASQDGTMYICPVKNRFAKSYADGKWTLPFTFDGDRCRIQEQVRPAWTPSYSNYYDPPEEEEDPWNRGGW